MKQVVAMGRWSKEEQQWKTVVALRRIGAGAKPASSKRGEHHDAKR